MPPVRPVARAGPMAEAGTTPPLPAVALTSGLLYQILAAEIAVQRGELGPAFATFMALAKETRDPRFAQRATEVAIGGRALAQALEAATLWRGLAPQSTDALHTLAALLVANHRIDEAAPLLREQVANDPQPAEALGRAQRVLARASDRAAAFRLLEELAAPYRDDPRIGADVRLVLASGAQAAGDSQRAAQEAQAALALRPDFERAALLAAQFLSRPDGKESAAGRAQALSLLHQFLRRQPQALEARQAYARLLVADGRHGEARAQFERVLQQQQDNLDALYALGVLDMESPATRAAARRYFERYLQALEEAPQAMRDPDPAYLNLARIAEEQKKYDEALAWLARVSGADNRFLARLRHALVLGKMQRVDEARQLLAELQPSSDAARVQIAQAEGQLLREAKRYAEALQVLAAALARYPDDPGLLYDTAMAAEKMNRLDLVERHLRRLIELKPDDAHAYNALGYTFADRNQRLPEALALIEKALSLAPNDAYILDSMGWVYFRLGDLPRAREYLERAFQLKPEAEVGAHLGEVLWLLGERDEARRVWRTAWQHDADNETLRETLARFNVRF
ncbi:MAG: tetratricopeptide repeat protein [Sutterellaceae bacterium]|nr:tetratricopeptide repeat protein [Burkholderiaceae bacterium]MDW8430265.1 tetratricopeptide repeat protein [Sutterellaceae bacterium]